MYLISDHTLQSPYEEQCKDSPAHGTRSVHHRWPQIDRDGLWKSGGRHLPFLRSLRSRSKSNRLHGHHPVSWCCPPAPQQQPLHYSHNKRVHARPRDATSASVPHPGLDLELQPGTGISSGGFMPMAQRHEHHHLHEHHHHHHHHHHYYSSWLQPLTKRDRLRMHFLGGDPDNCTHTSFFINHIQDHGKGHYFFIFERKKFVNCLRKGKNKQTTIQYWVLCVVMHYLLFSIIYY